MNRAPLVVLLLAVAGSAWSCRDAGTSEDARSRVESLAAVRVELDATLAATGRREEARALAATFDAERASVEASVAEGAYAEAVRHLLLAASIGHTGTFLDDADARCAPSFPLGFERGVSAVPNADGFLVTDAATGNPLGLAKGDVVLALDAITGLDAMTDEVLRRPFCQTVYPSRSGKQAKAALAFARYLPAGVHVRVRQAGGGERVVVTATADIRRASTSAAASPTIILREDGLAVLRLPTFLPTADELQSVIDTLPAALAGLVIDVRGNPGGDAGLADDLASALIGARETAVMTCRSPSFPDGYRSGLHPGHTPIVVPAVRTSVLVDGLAYSAASTFARDVALGTDAVVVGLADAGAYASDSRTLSLAGPPAFDVKVDDSVCLDPAGAPVEGRPIAPRLRVEMSPDDVARNVDTQLEAAVRALRAGT